MKTCENCGNEHKGTYGSGRFCSTKCARGFSTKNKRSLINEKVSKKLSNEKKTFYCRNCGIEIQSLSIRKYCSTECQHEHMKKQDYYKKAVSTGSKNNGGYRKGSGRGKGCWYISKIAGKVYLDSTWELAYAKYLDEHNIKWERNTKRFYYNDVNYYIPDFYLINENMYIEIKGFQTDKDLEKWKAVDNLKVINGKDLQNLGII